MLQSGWKPTKPLSLTSLWVSWSSSYWDSSLAALFWPAGSGGVLTRAAVSGGVSKTETRWEWQHTICTQLPGRLPGGFSAATSLLLCRWVWVIRTGTVNNLGCCAILYGTVQALMYWSFKIHVFTLQFTFNLNFIPRSRFNKFFEWAQLIGIFWFYHFSSSPGCYLVD